MASDRFLSMKNFLWQSESREKVRLDGKWRLLIEVFKMYGLILTVKKY